MEKKHSLKKDDMRKLDICDMSTDGAGIGKADGVTLFVKDAVIGDHILAKVMKMKKSYGYARMTEIITPSPYRVQPRCEFHRQCGGCQLQSLDYGKQLEFKENKVKNNLERIGGFTEVEEVLRPVIGMDEPFYYRNKAQFPIGRNKEGRIVTGFYASRTHQIIPNRKCALGAAVNEQILNLVISFMEQNGIVPYDEKTGTGLVRHVLIRTGFFTGEIMVCIVINGTKLPYAEKLVDKLCRIEGMSSITLNVNRKNTNVILGEKLILLWGQEYITDTIGAIRYQISPLSFFQVNPIQTKRLYEKALEYAELTGTETVWDLYCGIGTISLFLAQRAKQVYGVEVIPAAIKNARENARENGICNVEFLEGKAEEVLPKFYERDDLRRTSQSGDMEISESMLHPDVIVVDPPRKGCDERCLNVMVQMSPSRIVYVSCDSATLARDLKFLCENGYELKKMQPVDMFPQTVGVENVCLLSKLHTDQHIEVEF